MSGFEEYQKKLTEQMDYVIRNSGRPNKMSVEERKINKICSTSANASI